MSSQMVIIKKCVDVGMCWCLLVWGSATIVNDSGYDYQLLRLQRRLRLRLLLDGDGDGDDDAFFTSL